MANLAMFKCYLFSLEGFDLELGLSGGVSFHDLAVFCEAAAVFSWLGVLLDFMCLMANLLRFCMFPASIHDILNGRTPAHQCCQSLGPGWL